MGAYVREGECVRERVCEKEICVRKSVNLCVRECAREWCGRESV
jgi:hypothetical protein